MSNEIFIRYRDSCKKIFFRFLLIYLFLQAAPWFLSSLPGFRFSKKYFDRLMDWAVHLFNSKLFSVRKVLVPQNQNIDSSWAWAQQWFLLFIALTGCLLWSLFDTKRKSYAELNYWLSLFSRYFIAIVSFGYGIQKLFALQMPFPSQSLLATPLGDFLPYRLSWVFMGYSSPYQIFGGCMEVLTGILLLYRKTATLGALLGLGVFSNVLIMNLSFDIPAKILSINVVFFCLFLLTNEYKRLVDFFLKNKPVQVSNSYNFPYSNKWARIARLFFKISFIMLFTLNFFGNWRNYKAIVSGKHEKIIKPGIYEVSVYKVNNNIIPPLITDSMRWQEVIFEKGNTGSIKTADSSFYQKYKRGYFTFQIDTINHIVNLKKWQTDSVMYKGVILSLHYQMPDSSTIKLWGRRKGDSLYVLLKRSNRFFPLAERQFNWLTEYHK